MTVMFRGKPACECLAEWLPAYEAELLRRGVIKHNIDIFQLIGGAAASAGTHSKGGAFDIAQTSDEAIRVARLMGADATWHRPFNWDGKGGVSHTHGVLRGCPHNGPARYQIDAVDAGFNGLGHLGRGGKDTGPRPLSGRTWRQGIAWAKRLADPKVVDFVPGDWNLSAHEVAALAKSAGASFVKGSAPDHAIARGIKVTKTEVLAKGGSDHHPIVYHCDVDGRKLTVLAWNVYVGQSPLRARVRLSRLVAKYQPDIIALSEANRCGKHLRGLGKHRRYQVFQGPNVGEGADCALLVRTNLHVTGHGVARMTRNWIGPKHHHRHSPREYPVVRIRLAPGLVLRVMAVHLPFGEAAVEESTAHVGAWLKNGAKQ